MFFKVGAPTKVADGSLVTGRATSTGEAAMSQSHGAYQEAALRGNLFSAGMTITSIANATFTTATLGATATPIIGVWNPSTNTKNLVILQVRVQVVNTALQVTGGGAMMWCSSTGQSGISTGITPLNRGTLASSGSIAKGYAATALTGLSGNMSIQEATGVGGLLSNASTLQTAVGLMPQAPTYIDFVDGAIIVPPGGVLAMLCTTTPVAVSCASSILWEEVQA